MGEESKTKEKEKKKKKEREKMFLSKRVTRRTMAVSGNVKTTKKRKKRKSLEGDVFSACFFFHFH